MNVKMKYMGLNINQIYYSTIINGYSLGVIINFVSEEQKLELKKVLDSMKFK